MKKYMNYDYDQKDAEQRQKLMASTNKHRKCRKMTATRINWDQDEEGNNSGKEEKEDWKFTNKLKIKPSKK